MILAMRRTLPRRVDDDLPPEFMVLRSSVQISGRSARMWSTRFSGFISVVPGAATLGSSCEGTKRPPGPVVMLRIRAGFLRRIRSTTSW